MTDEERRRIHKDAKDVIENADSVREALLIWINQGHQDLASKAYAIKSRVSGIDSVLKAAYLLTITEKASEYREIMVEQLEQEKLASIKEYTDVEIDYFDIHCSDSQLWKVRGVERGRPADRRAYRTTL